MHSKSEGQAAARNEEGAVEMGQRSMEAVAELTQRNMEVMLAVARVTIQGVQAIVGEMTDFSKQSLQRASSAAEAMTTVTASSELVRLQADFAWAQFDAARAQMMKLSESMFQTAREQLSAQAALARLGSGPRADNTPSQP